LVQALRLVVRVAWVAWAATAVRQPRAFPVPVVPAEAQVTVARAVEVESPETEVLAARVAWAVMVATVASRSPVSAVLAAMAATPVMVATLVLVVTVTR
jgi:hypothetical protein